MVYYFFFLLCNKEVISDRATDHNTSRTATQKKETYPVNNNLRQLVSLVKINKKRRKTDKRVRRNKSGTKTITSSKRLKTYQSAQRSVTSLVYTHRETFSAMFSFGVTSGGDPLGRNHGLRERSR